MYECIGRVGDDMITKAKSVNLEAYLKDTHPGLIVYDSIGKRYVLNDDKDTIIGDRGFYNFRTHYKGDQIQCLMDISDLTFPEAVSQLCYYSIDNPDKLLDESIKTDTVRTFSPPKRALVRYKCVWAYLVHKRKIPHEIVEELFDDKTLYQSYDYNNCVFYSSKCEYAEVNGTTDNRYKQLTKGSEPDGYWITGDASAEICYICKSAIDAISLKALHKKYFPDDNACYISICGYNKDALKRIKNEGYKNIIFAFPYSDDTLNICADFDLCHIFPSSAKADSDITDWNDVLKYATDENKIKSLFENVIEGACPF